jgi:ATP-dependent DNA helicase RecQ
MEKVLIVARTRAGNGVEIGGLTREQNRSVRVLPPEGQSHPADTRLDVGQVWEFEFHDAPDVKPPHVEDIIVSSGKRAGFVSNMREVLLEHIQPWEGGPEQLYDGLLTIVNGKAYISEQNELPPASTGFWLPDRPLTLNFQSNPPKPYYSLVLGEATTKSAVEFLNIPFVGFAEPIKQIPAGTLVRVSLARWFDQNGRTERRCYLQLSGWYL